MPAAGLGRTAAEDLRGCRGGGGTSVLLIVVAAMVKGQSLVMMGWSRRVIQRGVVSRLVEGETRRMLMGLEVEG